VKEHRNEGYLKIQGRTGDNIILCLRGLED